jgi:hypothetical protein
VVCQNPCVGSCQAPERLPGFQCQQLLLSLLRRWERASLGKLLSKVSVAEMERAGSTKRLPLLASVNGGDISGTDSVSKMICPLLYCRGVVLRPAAAAVCIVGCHAHGVHLQMQ